MLVIAMAAARPSIAQTFYNDIKNDSKSPSATVEYAADLPCSDQENESPGPHRRRPSHLSVSSEATTAMTTASMASPCTPAPSAGPHSVFSITSIVNPPSSGEPQYRSSVPAFENGLTRNSFPFVAVASSDESTTWGYSERSQSPISDYNPTYPHRVSISSPSSVVDMYSNHPTPLMSSTMPGWEPMLLPPSALPSNMLEPEPRSFPTVGIPLLRSMHNC